MKMRPKILIDRVVGIPLSYLLNLAARVLGFFLVRDHSIDPEETRHIVVAKYAGLGSIVNTTPLLRALRRGFAKAEVTFVTTPAGREIVKRLDEVDRTLVVDDREIFSVLTGTLRLLGSLWRKPVDIYIDLEVYSAYASLVSTLSCARNRIGFYRRSIIFRRGLYTHLLYFNTSMPIRQIYLQLGRVVGADVPEDELLPLPVAEEERRGIEKKVFGDFDLGEKAPCLVVNPNASDLLPERRWPLERFAGLLETLLTQRPDLQALLIGSSGERPYVEKLRAMLPASLQDRVINTAGLITIGELLALLERATCMLTNDSGPMHMAFSLDTPVVCLFGPVSPEHYAVSDRSRVRTIYNRIYCSPCLHHADVPPCGGDNQCMKSIGEETVLKALNSLLEPEPSVVEAHEGGGARDIRFFGETGSPLGIIVR